MKLTCREGEVLELLVQGHTNKKIAQRLRISDFTVRDHVSSLLFKYGVGSRMALIVEVGRVGDGARGVMDPLHRWRCQIGSESLQCNPRSERREGSRYLSI